MFARKFRLAIASEGQEKPVPKAWLDQFFMRNFLGYSAFDETLVTGDGEMEAGNGVPAGEIQSRFETWLRGRKMIAAGERLIATEIQR